MNQHTYDRSYTSAKHRITLISSFVRRISFSIRRLLSNILSGLPKVASLTRGFGQLNGEFSPVGGMMPFAPRICVDLIVMKYPALLLHFNIASSVQ